MVVAWNNATQGYATSRGYQPIEYKGFGLADQQANSREIFDEAVRLGASAGPRRG